MKPRKHQNNYAFVAYYIHFFLIIFLRYNLMRKFRAIYSKYTKLTVIFLENNNNNKINAVFFEEESTYI